MALKNRVVSVEQGLLEGIFGYDPRITVFKGVPYAEAPVGDLRWRVPQPPKKWDGVRLASEYGPMAMQDVPGLDPNDFWSRELHPAGPEFQMSEDCLYLNIFTPAKTGDEKLPVLFYIHGGGYQGGYSYEIEFDWEHMARKGIVVVSINYRLGVMGFLAHPWLSEEAPDEAKGNYGTMDQCAALHWVKRNIAAFGGDPEKIVIAGQSAGCGSVQSQLNSPMNRGVMRGAILQSGASIDLPDTKDVLCAIPLAEAEQTGKELFESLGINSLEEARKMDAKKLIDLTHTTFSRGLIFKPTVDGIFLHENNSDSMLHGNWADVPVIAGFNRGEMARFHGFFGKAPLNREELTAFADKYGAFKDEYLELVKDVQTDDEVKALFASDQYDYMLFGNRYLGHAFSKQGKTAYLYEFDAEMPGDEDTSSFHGAELWYAYDALARSWRPFKGKDYDLARTISSYWVNFVKNLDPNGVDTFGEPLPEWPVFDAANEQMMKFTDHAEVIVPDTTDIMKLRMKAKDVLL